MPAPQKKIYIRPEPWTAQYYTGKNHFLDDLILSLMGEFSVTVLPRDQGQIRHYKSKMFTQVHVADKPISLETIYSTCALFIGAGGSMTRELAFLGVPTLSVYQNELLEVDKFLINNKMMHFSLAPTLAEVTNLLNNKQITTNNNLQNKGVLAFNLINKKLYDLAKN